VGANTNLLADHTVPDPHDRAAVLARLEPAPLETLAVRDFWNACSPRQSRMEESLWEAPPSPVPEDELISYEAPGGLSVYFGLRSPVIQVRALLRWRSFLSLEPLRRVHLCAFRRIAALLGATRILYMPDDESITGDARWEGATFDDCAAELRRRWGPPQAGLDEIEPLVVQAADHGVPRVWFAESVSGDWGSSECNCRTTDELPPEAEIETDREPPPQVLLAATYDDHEAVTAYLESHWQRYMTEFERKCHGLASRRVKALLDPETLRPQSVLAEYEQADEAVRDRIACGLREFERRVRERILEEFQDGRGRPSMSALRASGSNATGATMLLVRLRLARVS
jgi:hypothetical protein